MSSYNKATIYVKTTPASMGYLIKADMRCGHCRQYAKRHLDDNPKFVSVCANGNKCKLANYIADRLPNVEYKILENNNREIVIVTHSIAEIERAQTIVNRAIRLHTHQLYKGCK